MNRGCWIIMVLVLPLLAMGEIRAPERRPPDSDRSALRVCIDAGDSYRSETGVRKLLRVDGQVVVHLWQGKDLASNKLGVLSRHAGGKAAEYVLREEPRGNVLILKANAAAARGRWAGLAAMAEVRKALAAEPGVAACNPVFVDSESGYEVILTAEIIVRLRPGVEAADYFGADWARTRPLFIRGQEYIVTLNDVTAEQVLGAVNRHAADERVEWAEPNMLSEVQKTYQPNDPMFDQQWHHDHIGQNGTKTNADIRTPQAWDLVGGGSSDIVIAIVDDGVDWAHPDLLPALYVNTNDNDNDGVDDDGNGAVDDAIGFNFVNTNGNSFPTAVTDRHGTSCAGMAAARGDNGIGVAGSAYRCRILPVKIGESNNWLTAASVAQAILYAAGLDGASNQVWRGADILSMSFGYNSGSAAGNNALTAAGSRGRGGKGCVMFGSSGNDGSGYEYYLQSMSNYPAGSYFLQFEYYKDNASTGGMDTVWLSNILLPDAAGTRAQFTSQDLPAGWSTGGNAPFTVEDDPVYAYGTCRYQARSGAIGNNQTTWLRSPSFTLVPTNNLRFSAWIDTERGAGASYPPPAAGGDWLYVRLYSVQSGSWVTNIAYESGQPGNHWVYNTDPVSTTSHWPSVHASVIGVGGVTDMGYRYHGSQYRMTGLEFVSPTAGGIDGVWSTDRVGTNGYNTSAGVAGNYTAFNGTSAATPLAAGVGALLLSANTNLTRTQVRQRMRDSCDKVGDVPYVNGTNLFYGYGRINAYHALLTNNMPTSAVATHDTVRNQRVYYSGGTQTASNGFEIVSPGSVTFRARDQVRLVDGFRAYTGSVYRTVIDPDL